jgi:glycosyltransferase involved in cell wall biosynthesis
MRICAVVKYPPIQGGVSALSYRLVMALGAAGHQVSVVTNADEVEDDYRIWMTGDDRDRLEADFPGGGSVRLAPSSPLGRKHAAHIPDHRPFATKLAALATEEIRRIDADVVYSYYLEPYGVAAQLAAMWTGVPHVVQHAGSDRTRLLAHPDMSLAYREVLRHADLVLGRPGTIEGFGVAAERVMQVGPRGLPAAFTDPQRPVLDVNALIADLATAGHRWISNAAPMPVDRPTIGIYGKIGEYKGSYDLLAALARLKEQGRQFNLLLMAGGYQRERFLHAVEGAGLSADTWTLPFLPHWRVPEFLRAVTAACFLERRFPIRIHTPGIPREVLAVGTCLVVSREVADKQPVRDEMRHGENIFVVEEPSDPEELAGVLGRIVDDPEAARAVGKAGGELIQVDDPTDQHLAEAYVMAFERAIDLRSSHPYADWSTPAWDRLVRRYMPATVAAVGDRIGEAVDAVVADAGSEPERAYAAANALVDLTDRDRDELPPGAGTAALFERDALWSSLDLEGPRGGTLFPRRGAQAMVLSDPVTLWTRKPVACTTLRVRRYRDDIEDLLAALRSGRTVEAAEPATTAMFLFLKRGDLDGRVVRISPATADLLARCDGTNTVNEIVAALDAGFGASRAEVERMILDLVDMRAILL